jgi:predicted RNA binding protein YcfA (HicA-like mRNA interferase family)
MRIIILTIERVGRMKFRELESIIKNDGWEYAYTTGSHYHYRHQTKPGKVTIPMHGKDLDIRTVQSVFKQAQIRRP